MAGPGHRLFTMNIGGLAVVCLLNPFLVSLECLDSRPEIWIAEATGVKMGTQLGAVSSCIRWAYGVQGSQDSELGDVKNA